jgi:hypothetical protein
MHFHCSKSSRTVKNRIFSWLWSIQVINFDRLKGGGWVVFSIDNSGNKTNRPWSCPFLLLDFNYKRAKNSQSTWKYSIFLAPPRLNFLKELPALLIAQFYRGAIEIPRAPPRASDVWNSHIRYERKASFFSAGKPESLSSSSLPKWS